jgi:hypothetical protein
VSVNHNSGIHSHLSPLDLPGDESFSELSSNGADAPVSDQGVVATGARVGEQNTGAANHDLAELVWKYFDNEIREALQEVQDNFQANYQMMTQVIEGKK